MSEKISNNQVQSSQSQCDFRGANEIEGSVFIAGSMTQNLLVSYLYGASIQLRCSSPHSGLVKLSGSHHQLLAEASYRYYPGSLPNKSDARKTESDGRGYFGVAAGVSAIGWRVYAADRLAVTAFEEPAKATITPTLAGELGYEFNLDGWGVALFIKPTVHFHPGEAGLIKADPQIRGGLAWTAF